VSEAGVGVLRLGLIGSPNSGKTTLFNALTGLRAKVANYPGVTVERREGDLEIDGRRLRVIDLPGTYSLTPISPDEAVVGRVIASWARRPTRCCGRRRLPGRSLLVAGGAPRAPPASR
jgi:ribosome-interacting GTPase 1